MSLRRFGAVIVSATAALAVLAADTPAAATTTKPAFSYDCKSAVGDFIGCGSTNHYAPPTATFSISGDASYLTLSVTTASDWWNIVIAAPRGETLRPGVYRRAERAAFRTGRAPGLDVSGNGSGCNEVWGGFVINQIQTDGAGAVTVLDATFTQHCERADAPPLKGRVLYNALPLSYRFRSDPGDYIGGGASHTYLNSTSTFGLSGTRTSLQYSVSGDRDQWIAILAAPTGQRLRVGSYDARRFPDATHAGLDVFGNGRGCNEVTGTLTIKAIETDVDRNVTRLWATFDQHCEGGEPALHGTIHYFA